MMSVVNCLLVLCLMTLEIFTTVVADKCPAKADIVLILDYSGSVGLENYKKQLRFGADLTKNFNIGPNDVQFGALVYSGAAIKLFDLTDHTNSSSLENGILREPYLNNRATTDTPLRLFLEMFSISAGARPDASKIAIIMTDGISDNQDQILKSADLLKDSGVDVIAIGIDLDSRTELRGMASNDQNVFTVDNFNVLNDIQKKVAKRTCQVTEEKDKCQAKADIVLILDSSSSVRLGDYNKQRKFAADLTKTFNIGPNHVQFGAVVFGDYVIKLFDLKDTSTSLESEILKAPYLKKRTQTEKALRFVLESQMFSSLAGGRLDASKTVIIMTNGISENIDKTLDAAVLLKANGVDIIAIGIGQASRTELRGMSSSDQNVFTVNNSDVLSDIQKNVSERTCQVTEENVVGNKCKVKTDIVFILDASSSVGEKKFTKELHFAADIIKHFIIASNDVHFGAVVYSDDARKLFDLKDNTNSTSLESEILMAPYLDSITRTDKAIRLVLDSQMFSTLAGGRPNAIKIAIIMTGGTSENTNQTLDAASQLKSSGVTIMPIGIGKAPLSELRGMASSDQDVFTADNFEVLTAIQKKVRERKCIVLHIDMTVLGDKCPAKADTVLILDASGSVGEENYFKQLMFAADLTKTFNIGPNNVQFGAVVFSDEAIKLFDLADNTNSTSLESEIFKAPYLNNRTHTDTALRFVLDSQMFSISAGGRPDASKIAIIMTNSISVNIDKTLDAAVLLKASGVDIIAIGIGQASKTELRGMASSDQNVFTVDNFDVLSDIQKKVTKRTCQVPEEKAGQLNMLISGLTGKDGQCFLYLQRNIIDPDQQGNSEDRSNVSQLTEIVRQQIQNNDLKISLDTCNESHSSLENTLSQSNEYLKKMANKQKICEDSLTKLRSRYNQFNSSEKFRTALFNVSSEYNGKYYLLSKILNVNVDDSQLLCEEAGGYLVEIDDSGEQAFIKNFLNTFPVVAMCLLTGGTDEGQEGRWIWRTSQRPLSYTNWIPQEPQNHSNWNCLGLYKDNDFRWYGETCTINRNIKRDINFLCEVPSF